MSKAIDPRDYVVTADTEISPIDLDREEFTLRGGRRLTEALAKELADEARAEIRRGNLIPVANRCRLQGSILRSFTYVFPSSYTKGPSAGPPLRA